MPKLTSGLPPRDAQAGDYFRHHGYQSGIEKMKTPALLTFTSMSPSLSRRHSAG
jgi:hypothetical protein